MISREKLLNKIFLVLSILLFLISLGNNAFAQFDDKLVVFETNLGTIVIEFFPNDAPNHIDNFIDLTESGFYDGVLFHRIIPGFMIQGGDPNTIDGDPNTWGTGGPTTSVNAEFNTIKHNRGIVSMARSADPNSGSSQFFIVHADSNFLDEQYTVFGRIVTEESFETLDKIASVNTDAQDRPQKPEQVKITKAITVNHSEISNLLELDSPIRTESTITTSTDSQKYENSELNVRFNVPEGWLLQTSNNIENDSPDVVVVGPKTGVMNPVISLTVQETDDRTLDDLISEKNETLKSVIAEGNLKIISQQKMNINGYDTYIINAEGYFSSNGKNFNIAFQEVMIYNSKKFYTMAYSNGIDNYNSELSKFKETVDSFEILTEATSNGDFMNKLSSENSGGCLIATATFGSELAPQVQQLREFRDNIILSTEYGTVFMSGFNQFYYSFSPIIADMERENPLFKEFVKLSITPILFTLSILNYVEIDSEIEMVFYGIGIILMNVGMYFTAPVIIIYKIRK